MPEFYMIFARKNIFPIFLGGGGGQVPPAPVSYAYGLSSLKFSRWAPIDARVLKQST